jgi:hypothetical protein
MAEQFDITVKITKSYVSRKTLTIWAEDEGEAEEKAVEMVENWNHGNADDVEVEID